MKPDRLLRAYQILAWHTPADGQCLSKPDRLMNYLCLSCAALLMVFATAVGAQDDLVRHDIYLDAMRLINEGRKQEASGVLTQLVQQEPEHAGAWLDLAILQCELGHVEEAERLFALILTRFHPPQGIIEVIAQHRMQGCAGLRPDGRTSLMLGRGIDDNVNQGASTPYFTLGTGSSRIELQLLPAYLPKRDGFTVLTAEYARGLPTVGTTGFVYLQARQNDKMRQYDTALIAAGVEHPWHIAGYRIYGSGTLAALSMGGRLYQQRGQFQAGILPPLPLPENLQFSLWAGLTHITYPTLPSFDANLREIRGMLEYRLPQTRLQLNMGNLYDRALAARAGGNRRGWLVGMRGQTQVTENIFGELEWSRQTWQSESAYSPGLIEQRRSQSTDTLNVALVIPVAPHHAMRFEWREVRNNENISLFQYKNRILMGSWQWHNF